jgi:hypothetical protein
LLVSAAIFIDHDLKALCLVAEPKMKLNVAEASRPNRIFKVGEHQNHTEVGQPCKKLNKEAVLINWMTPLIWSVIDRAATHMGYQMQPTIIVKELKRIDLVLFKSLTPQTLGAWITHEGDQPAWSAVYWPSSAQTQARPILKPSNDSSAI